MPSTEEHRYFVIFLDVYSKYLWYFPLRLKSDVFPIFIQFHKMVERQFSTKIKQIQTDWGGEYRSLRKFFKEIGIVHRLPCPHTHEQNGKIERRHRHIVEIGLALLAHGSVPQMFWHFACFGILLLKPPYSSSIVYPLLFLVGYLHMNAFYIRNRIIISRSIRLFMLSISTTL